jgi:hypothetical protein
MHEDVLGWAVSHEAMPADRLVGLVLVWVGLALVAVDQLGTPDRRLARGLSPTAGG